MSPSPLPRDLSEHIPLIVTTNIRITTLLCRCNNKYLDIIWKLHCYNLSVLLQQLCVEIILLQLLNVVTVFITTYSLNVVTMEYFIVTITITSFAHARFQWWNSCVSSAEISCTLKRGKHTYTSSFA